MVWAVALFPQLPWEGRVSTFINEPVSREGWLREQSVGQNQSRPGEPSSGERRPTAQSSVPTNTKHHGAEGGRDLPLPLAGPRFLHRPRQAAGGWARGSARRRKTKPSGWERQRGTQQHGAGRAGTCCHRQPPHVIPPQQAGGGHGEPCEALNQANEGSLGTLPAGWKGGNKAGEAPRHEGLLPRTRIQSRWKAPSYEAPGDPRPPAPAGAAPLVSIPPRAPGRASARRGLSSACTQPARADGFMLGSSRPSAPGPAGSLLPM